MSANRADAKEAFVDSSEEEQDDDVYDDRVNSQDEEEDIEFCQLPDYVATKEYVHGQTDHVRRLAADDADRAMRELINPVTTSLQRVVDTQSNCLRRWSEVSPYNADLWRISNTGYPQEEKMPQQSVRRPQHSRRQKAARKISAAPVQQTGKRQRAANPRRQHGAAKAKTDAATKGYVDDKIQKEIDKALAHLQRTIATSNHDDLL